MDFILKNEDFDIKKILESGQNFSYTLSKDSFFIKREKLSIEIKTIDDKTYFNIDEEFFNKYLFNYFDMNTNYELIRNNINKNFPELKKYTDFGKGLRFLNQDFIEVSTTFIISQNNNMKRIKSSIEKLVDIYGKEKEFPSLDKLKTIKKEDFRQLGVGFRDEYLYKFYQTITIEQIEDLKKMATREAFETLVSFKGIGPKVANCILLFGLGKRDVFPVDTHIKQIMEKLYFDEKNTSPKEIEEFALKKFRNYASYIQQYLFYYKVNNKI